MTTIESILTSNEEKLLGEVPKWVIKNIKNRLKRINKLIFVSAVCPDYERKDGKFTYTNVGDGLPFIAEAHLKIMTRISRCCREIGIETEYHVTLADTEFDLPEVMNHLVKGDSDEFLRRCQSSVDIILQKAKTLDIPIFTSTRFTEIFPQWFDYYQVALDHMVNKVKTAPQGDSIISNLTYEIATRFPLYRAMAGAKVLNTYCHGMVLRQWAQYMAWGKCAAGVFGEHFIMLNHDTPNLGFVNDQFFRKEKQRIPILKLAFTTMPC